MIKKYFLVKMGLLVVSSTMLFASQELVKGGGNENGQLDASKWTMMIDTKKSWEMIVAKDRGRRAYVHVNPYKPNAGMYQEIKTEKGKTYKVQGTLLGANHYTDVNNFSMGSSYLTIDSSLPNAEKIAPFSSKKVESNKATHVEFTFTAKSDTTYISLRGDKKHKYPSAEWISVREDSESSSYETKTKTKTETDKPTWTETKTETEKPTWTETKTETEKPAVTKTKIETVKPTVTKTKIEIVKQKPTQNVTVRNSTKLGKLKISANKRMLTYEDGTGFFWMGDTAWTMPRTLNREDVNHYMYNRKSRGFNVVMVTAVQDHHQANIYRNKPFLTSDYSQPNEEFWKHMDYIIESARQNNMYIALLPSWNNGIHNVNDARTYGSFIAHRYKNKSNIIWVVGGDSNPDQGNNKAIWNAMGHTINHIVGTNQLIAYHPSGNASSARWFHHESWLDFNMVQSGHCENNTNANSLLKSSYYKGPIKPVLDAEPRYETIQKCFSSNPGRRYHAKDVREIAYIQLFSGAFGHTYGHHSVWQMSLRSNQGSAPIISTVNSWKDALYAEGARQMTYVANLMRSRPIVGRVADQSIVASGYAIATRGYGYSFTYLPNGGSVTVNLGKISGNKVKAWWYNPITGDATEIGTYDNSGTRNFYAPASDDMVLVLDDINKGYQTPGQ